jgi:hypothetical protein
MIQHSISPQAMSAPESPNLRTSQSHNGKSVTVLRPSHMFGSQAFHGNATPGAQATQARNGLSRLHALDATAIVSQRPCATSPTASNCHDPDSLCRKFHICASFFTVKTSQYERI